MLTKRINLNRRFYAFILEFKFRISLGFSSPGLNNPAGGQNVVSQNRRLVSQFACLTSMSSNLPLVHYRAQIACYEQKGDLRPVILKEIFYSSLKISKFTRICMKANGFRVYRSRSSDQLMQKAYYSVPHQR